MAKTQPAMATVSRLASSVLKQSYAAKQNGVRLGDHYSKELVDDIFACALKKQTGVSLKYMCVYLSSKCFYFCFACEREQGCGNEDRGYFRNLDNP